MKTLSMHRMSKAKAPQWSAGQDSVLLRLRTFLLRDLVPSLIMVILLSVGAFFVAEKIDEAKTSRSVSMVDRGLQQ